MSKRAVYFTTFILCILLQAGVSPAIAIAGCSPNFLLIPVLLVSMRSGMAAGSITGFLLGLLQDLMGSGTVGCMALAFTITALIVGALASGIDVTSPLVVCIVVLISALFVELAYGTIEVLVGSQGSGIMITMLTHALPSGLYSTAFGCIALVTIGLFLTDAPSAIGTRLGSGSPVVMGSSRRASRKPQMKSRLR